jgi:hypothetical protein
MPRELDFHANGELIDVEELGARQKLSAALLDSAALEL